MKAPKILPWIAKKSGISEDLALKLWRRALTEGESLTGQSDGAEYWGLVVERFLSLVEEESGHEAKYSLTPAPKLTWVWRHQTRMSLLSLMAAQNTVRFWQNTWENMIQQKKAA